MKIRKRTGTVVLICLITGIVGCVMMGISWWLGFRTIDLSNTAEQSQMNALYIVPDQNIQNVVLRANAGTILVVPGEEFSITQASSEDCFIQTYDNGTWTVETTESPASGGIVIGDFYINNSGVRLSTVNSIVYVTMPSHYDLEQLAIDNYSGTVRVGSFSCRTLNVTVETGSVDFTVNPGAYVYISNEAGKINGTLFGNEEDYHMVLESDLGRVRVGTKQISFLTSREYESSQATREMLVDCGAGRVELRFNALALN